MPKHPFKQLKENEAVLLVHEGETYVAIKVSATNLQSHAARAHAQIKAITGVLDTFFERTSDYPVHVPLQGFSLFHEETSSHKNADRQKMVQCESVYRMTLESLRQSFGDARVEQFQLHALPTYELKENKLVQLTAGSVRTKLIHALPAPVIMPPTAPQPMAEPPAHAISLQPTLTAEEMNLLSAEDKATLLHIREQMHKSVALLNELTSVKSEAGSVITQAELDRLQAVAGSGIRITNSKGPKDRIELSYSFTSDESQPQVFSESKQVNRPVALANDSVKLSR